MEAHGANTRGLRRAQLLVTGISIAFAFLGLVLLGDLNQHMLLAAAIAGLMIVPAFLVHNYYSTRLLGPVTDLISRLNEDRQPNDEQKQEARDALRSFRAKESRLALVFWGLGGLVVCLVLGLTSGVTTWQLVILASIIICSALVNVVLSSYVETTGLGAIKSDLESRGLAIVTAGTEKRSIFKSALMAYSVILLVAVGFVSLVWFSRMRARFADEIVSEVEPGIRTLAGEINDARSKDPTMSWVEALRKVDPENRYMASLAVLDRRGNVVVKPPMLQVNPVWFNRLAEAQVERWGPVRVPFLFLTRRLAKGNILVWVAPISRVYDKTGLPLTSGVAGGALALVLCVFLAWSTGRSSSHSLSALASRFQRVARGELDLGQIQDEGGELARLENTIGDFARTFKQSLGASSEKVKIILIEQGRLADSVKRFAESSERRTDVADQTATSVVEMRSAIQSISEQMESLREASSDCTSAMFEIDQSVREVAGSAENLQGLVEDTASAMTEITVSMTQVVNNVDDLAKTAEETVHSVTVMDGSIKQVEESTNQTKRVSDEVSELASRGAKSVSQTIEGINEIQEVTDEAREVINRLGTQMEAVGKILTVIGDVAEQTNLLALNAAIIAAAAGEHGKGFAVVADEIKDLADRTSTSTKEIAGLIRSVQSESRLAIDAMQRGSGSVRRGVELANTAGEALKQILDSVRQVTEMANDIATSTTEHSNTTREINKSMSNMSAMVREIKRAVAEQSKGGARMGKASEQMRDDAKFVFRSAKEQVQAATGVTRNMERISEMVSFIGKAMVEQSNGVNHVAKVAEEVRDAFDQERAQIADLEEIADRIGRQARDFSSYIETFDQQEDERE